MKFSMNGDWLKSLSGIQSPFIPGQVGAAAAALFPAISAPYNN